MRESVGIFMLFALLAIVAVVAVDRLALRMERRGWIYWRKRKPSSGGGGGMSGLLTSFQQLVEPEIRHVIEAREQDRAMKVDLAGHGEGKTQPAKNPMGEKTQTANNPKIKEMPKIKCGKDSFH
jgi:hypothetical protein